MSITLKEYKNYLKTLDLTLLKKEVSYLIDYLDSLMGVHNRLLNIIIADIKKKLSILNKHLRIDVYDFLNNRNIDFSIIQINTKAERLDKNELYENILFNYSLIYDPVNAFKIFIC